MAKRCVITGIGMICALGNNLPECWENVKNGVSGIKDVKSVNTDGCYSHLGAEVNCDDLPAPEFDRSVRLCIKAANEAIVDSKLSDEDIKKAGIMVGSCVGGAASIDKFYTGVLNGNEDNGDVFKMSASSIANNVASFFKTQGVTSNIVNACAAGTMTISHACNLIKEDCGDVFLAGGTDSFSSLAFAGFHALHALSQDSCSPFNHSNGITLGEGSAILIVEEYEHAVKRGAKIYCEVIGSGVSSDAYHITAPHPQGEGQMSALTRAIKSAGIENSQVEYINAHGTGTAKNDAAEFLSLHTLFDDGKPMVSSTKSMTGHCLGAAGAIEAAITIKALTENIAPPTIGYSDEDKETLKEKAGDINFIANESVKKEFNTAMSNSFAFGGTNASIIFTKNTDNSAKDNKKQKYCITGIGELMSKANGEKSVFFELTPDVFAARSVKLGFYRKLDRFSQLEVLSGVDALKDAQIEVTPENASQIASLTGTCDGPMTEITTFQQSVCKNGTTAGSAFTFPNTVYNAAGGYLSIFAKIKGYCATAANGAQAGIQALCHACTELSAGNENACVVTGTDENSENITDIYSRMNLDYDYVLGEGSVSVVVETEDSANLRGAHKYAYIAGRALSHVPTDYTDTKIKPELLLETAQKACDNAQISLDDIDAVFTTYREKAALSDKFTNIIDVCEKTGDCRAASALKSVCDASKALGENKYSTVLCISESNGGACSAVILKRGE